MEKVEKLLEGSLWVITFDLRIIFDFLLYFQCCAFHPNGNYIASGSSDKTCRLWDLQSGQFVRVFVGHKVSIYYRLFLLYIDTMYI